MSRTPSGRWPTTVPDIVWAPLAAFVLLGVIALLTIITGLLLLLPSLAASVYFQTASPKSKTAAFYPLLVGHVIGIAAAIVVLALLGALQAPPVVGVNALVSARLLATPFAVGLTVLGGIAARAVHPPATATTVIICLGGFQISPEGLLSLIGSILIIAVLGETLRRVRLGVFPGHLL